MAADLFYHYTDFEALDGILRCAQLRVNNVLRMNDSAEMRHFMVRLSRAIVERLEAGGETRRAREVRALFQEELAEEYSAYAACFSFRRDDAAQWERYGNRGRGVCIAFRGDLLRRMAEGPLSLHTVFYEDDMTGHPMVDRFCRLIRDREALTGGERDIRLAMRDAWACSVAFKHPSFSSEDEVRLVVAPFGQEEFDVQPRYHVTKERVKKYYPLDLRDMCGRGAGGAGGGDHHRPGVHPIPGHSAGLPPRQRFGPSGGKCLPVRLPPAGHAGIVRV